MKVALLLSTTAVMSTSVSAALWGLFGTDFTFNTEVDLKGEAIKPKQQSAPTDCITNNGNPIRSVAIDYTLAINTKFCIMGYDVAACDVHKDIIGRTWDTETDFQSWYTFQQDVKAAMVIEGVCPP